MAVVTTFLTASTAQPILDTGLYCVTKKFTAPATGANNADNLQLIPILRAGRLVTTHLNVKGTLGASATVKAQKNSGGTRTDLTIATTAGGASLVTSATIGPVDVIAGDIIELLVGGANISAAAAVELDITLQH
jgi:hypothetical protein